MTHSGGEGDVDSSVVHVFGFAFAVGVAPALPVSLLGAQAVVMRGDLALAEGGLGAAVGVYFASAAIASLPAERLCRRIELVAAMRLSVVASSVSLLGISLLATSYWHLLVLLCIAGAATALGYLASTGSLAVKVALGRRGAAFGTHSAAVPLATMFAGITVPVAALVLDWRWTYGATAIAVAILALPPIAPRLRAVSERSLYPSTQVTSGQMQGLGVLAIGVGLAGFAGNSVAPFLVGSLTQQGVRAEIAGPLLSLGSLAGIASRIGFGILADHRREGSLGLMALLLAGGSVGSLVLATGSDAQPAVGLLAAIGLAFGGAWGWGGLYLLAIARIAGGTFRSSMALVQVGPLTGGVLGPVTFGIIAEQVSYAAAWRGLAVAGMLAAVLVIVARRILTSEFHRSD